ncbi:acyl-CoA dehydrogenase family protein [Rubrivirga sp. IMCC45206]|uniref:acyl-CoA dehydrogenase family protein n=1 Tax=Rubrivirga sp. IMCC45206 TaxID=3391614 RepID=UPI00398FFBF2
MIDTLSAPRDLADLQTPADWVATARAVADRAAGRAAEDDQPGAFPEATFDDLRDSGLLAAPLPVSEGGAGLGTDPARDHALYLVLREIGRGSLPVGRVYEGHVNALALVDTYGTADQRARYAADARHGHLFGVWNTEIPRDGVRLTPLPGGRARMEGAKTFASGLGFVTRAFANGAFPDGGWQMALVPLDRADVTEDASWWTAEGMRASRSGRCDFTGVELDAHALVGEPGDYLREPHFTGGSVRFAAVQLGGAVALVDAAVAHLQKLGRTDNETQRLRIGEASVALETGALWLLGAARLAQTGSVEDVVTYAQAVRSAIEAVCLDVMRLVDRAVGARGLLPPSPVERIGRDLRLYLRQPAPDAALAAVGQAAFETPGRAQGSDL